MTVIGGHQRLKVLKDLQYKEVPCIVVALNKQKEKMLNIALNKISGDWDRPRLKDILDRFTVNFTYESNAIEGNSLTLKDVTLILEEKDCSKR